ncbi:MAG TPA: cupin domain-containing protein [Actinomycetota bacterium]|jgi:mannose-6-phosphate isomerase-like protein (cupin superfamily)
MESAAAVVQPGERDEFELPGSHGWVRLMIDGSLGARHLVQRVFRFEPGHTPDLHNETSDDVMFVVAGGGTLDAAGASIELAPGIACWVPAGVGYRIENEGPHDLVMVSVLSPPPGAPPLPEPEDRVPHRYSVHRDEQPAETAGEDRTFRLLVDPTMGCRSVTQFVGEIESIPAPPHTHSHEEVVFVIAGEGTVEIDGDVHPIGPGTSVFLPPGVEHRLASAGRESLELLGVFSPPGSPAAKEDGLDMTGRAGGPS